LSEVASRKNPFRNASVLSPSMKRLTILAALLPSLVLSLPTAVTARDRYAPRPPIYLSPDIGEPWLVQLRPRYRDVVGPGPTIPVAAPPVEGAPPAVVGRPAYPRPVSVAPLSDGSTERRVATIAPPAPKGIDRRFLPQEVAYDGPGKPGMIIVDTNTRYLYLVGDDGRARRYGVGVGRPGFEWAGVHTVTRKAEWPDWTPPAAMRKRQPYLPTRMAGGPDNPLGARALYLGSTEYRIHGTSEPWTIGQAVSSGCIRMRNEDVTDLYERVKVGAKVQVI
jgi:lipoprotein-anchoring transpeptidase ErfK/SrfK